MRVDEFLSQLKGIRSTRRGWLARCPAHSPDRNPSLSITAVDRGILLKCFAGCTVKEICAALGFKEVELFFDAPCSPRQRAMLPPRSQPFDWRRESSDLLHRAEELELRADYVRTHARGLDCANWTDRDIDAALATVGQANCDEQIAEIFRDVACSVRALCLAQEEQRDGSRRAAA